MTPTATVRTTATPSRARPLEALKQRPNQDVKKIELDKTGIEESNEIIVEKREKFDACLNNQPGIILFA